MNLTLIPVTVEPVYSGFLHVCYGAGQRPSSGEIYVDLCVITAEDRKQIFRIHEHSEPHSLVPYCLDFRHYFIVT